MSRVKGVKISEEEREAMEQQQKFDDDGGELEMNEDYVVFDDATAGEGSHLDLSNLRKRKTKIISSAKETIENGELLMLYELQTKTLGKLSGASPVSVVLYINSSPMGET